MCNRVVFHSDLNNCYASIECVLHPELKGKYIAVCGSTEERHGIVLAKNQLAKKCGVKTGDVIWEAKQKCPQLTIVPPHMDQYVKFSKLVRSMEQEGHCVDYTEATALELRELRVWIRPFLDQLPEYQHILDEILSEKE